MHDCHGCQVPLHGHEAFCPVCGQKQYVRPEFQGQGFEQYKKGFNPIGLTLIVVLLLGGIFYGVQKSWVGQLITRGPVAPAGDSVLTPQAAREKLEKGVLASLDGQSKTCKFVYTGGGNTVDKTYPQAVELAIEVYLKDPSKRKSIVEPVKMLMEPGLINTLTFTDNHSHATITYSVAGSAANTTDDDGDTAQSAGSQPAENNAQAPAQ